MIEIVRKIMFLRKWTDTYWIPLTIWNDWMHIHTLRKNVCYFEHWVACLPLLVALGKDSSLRIRVFSPLPTSLSSVPFEMMVFLRRPMAKW